jgi:hypothetical protein
MAISSHGSEKLIQGSEVKALLKWKASFDIDNQSKALLLFMEY